MFHDRNTRLQERNGKLLEKLQKMTFVATLVEH